MNLCQIFHKIGARCVKTKYLSEKMKWKQKRVQNLKKTFKEQRNIDQQTFFIAKHKM